MQIPIYRCNNMLNKWTEFINKCSHRNKCALASFMSRCILCDIYRMHVVAIIYVDLLHLSRGNFCVPCTVKSFEKRIVVKLIVPVHSAEDCCAIYKCVNTWNIIYKRNIQEKYNTYTKKHIFNKLTKSNKSNIKHDFHNAFTDISFLY